MAPNRHLFPETRVVFKNGPLTITQTREQRRKYLQQKLGDYSQKEYTQKVKREFCKKRFKSRRGPVEQKPTTNQLRRWRIASHATFKNPKKTVLEKVLTKNMMKQNWDKFVAAEQEVTFPVAQVQTETYEGPGF